MGVKKKKKRGGGEQVLAMLKPGGGEWAHKMFCGSFNVGHLKF